MPLYLLWPVTSSGLSHQHKHGSFSIRIYQNIKQVLPRIRRFHKLHSSKYCDFLMFVFLVHCSLFTLSCFPAFLCRFVVPYCWVRMILPPSTSSWYSLCWCERHENIIINTHSQIVVHLPVSPIEFMNAVPCLWILNEYLFYFELAFIRGCSCLLYFHRLNEKK